jgi:hypothetical protein
VGSAQPPNQWIPGALSLGVKLPGREADHSPPSSDEVNECLELYFHSSNTPSWRGAQLKKKHRTTLTLPLPLPLPLLEQIFYITLTFTVFSTSLLTYKNELLFKPNSVFSSTKVKVKVVPVLN